MGIIIALISAFFVGTANYLLKKSYHDVSPAIGLWIFTIWSIIIWTPVAFFFDINVNNLGISFFYGLISAFLAQGVYMYVLSKGELSITGTVLASYPIYTIIASYIFLGERLTVFQGGFVFLSILGTLIISLPQKIDKNDIVNTSYIAWPIIGAISIGLSDTLSKGLIDSLSFGTYIFTLSFAHIPVSLLAMFLLRDKFSQITEIISRPRSYPYVISGSLFISIGTMCIFLAFNFAPASIASPVTAMTPFFTILLALFFLKEKLSLKDWLGIICVTGGVIGIGVVS